MVHAGSDGSCLDMTAVTVHNEKAALVWVGGSDARLGKAK